MLKSKTRWKAAPLDEDRIQYWKDNLGVSSLVAKIMVSRGWDEATAKEMIETDQQEFHNPFLLDGMTEAVERIHKAIQQQEKVRIYGDYDCDGVSSTSLLYLVLDRLGAQFDFYIPNRFTEGYGLNKGAIDQAKQDGVELIITVDTGISSKEEVEYGQLLGIDFIITDHHEPPPDLPVCHAVINPKKPTCTYPYPHLAGAGVTLKLVQALLGELPEEWLDIATIGTVADLVPLTGENRLIVYHGLQAINRTRHVGIEALLHVSGLENDRINEEHVGFALGPRINASGRLETADRAVQLLISTSREEALKLAQEIDTLNQQRQKIVEQMTKEAIAWIEERDQEAMPKVLVVAKPDWNVGVVGIVASKLVERYYLPVIVLSIDEQKGLAKGSARSIKGFDMYQALRQCEDILPHFGGHPMAAGMTLKAHDVDQLRIRLDQLGEQWLTEEDFVPITLTDITCSIDEVTIEAVDELERLAPFGVSNSRPVILLKDLDIEEFRKVGAHQNHLKCRFSQGEAELDAIGFYFGEIVHKVSPAAKVNIVGQMSINEWNGKRKPQVQIKDLSVNERQYFDWRAQNSFEKLYHSICYDHKIALCMFRERKEVSFLNRECFQTFYSNKEGTVETDTTHFDITECDTVVFYDLPYSKEQVINTCRQFTHACRVYVCFQHHDQHFFSTIPGREHFKWYYAFLQKQETFNLNELGSTLARHKGWTMESVQFMTDVFLELEFATMKNGQIQLVKNPVKKDLEESHLYEQKKEEAQLEQEFIYSSFRDLIDLLEQFLHNEEKKEEALIYGL